MKFDEAIKVGRANPQLGGIEFEELIKERYIKDVSELLLVLQHSGQEDAATSFHLRAQADMKARCCPEVAARVARRYD